MAASLTAALDALEGMYGDEHWHWTAEPDPFEIAAGAILVQRTTWTNAERAIERLREAGALEPAAMATLTEPQLEALVRPAGQYRQKSAKLRAFLTLIGDFDSFEALLALPAETLRERLLDTWGIGEETADAIVLYAAKRPSFVIDAYTRRLFTRLDLGPGSDAPYRVWQNWFTNALPRDATLWGRIHAWIVLHGKHRCRARRPACHDCALAPRCPAAAVDAEAAVA